MNFYQYLVNHLPGAKFVDMTEYIDEIKVVKSDEEVELIRKTAALQDEAIAHVARTLKPGMRDFEALAEAQYSVVRNGSERQLILACSAPKGVPGPFQFRHFQNRVMREGDQFTHSDRSQRSRRILLRNRPCLSLGRPSGTGGRLRLRRGTQNTP